MLLVLQADSEKKRSHKAPPKKRFSETLFGRRFFGDAYSETDFPRRFFGNSSELAFIGWLEWVFTGFIRQTILNLMQQHWLVCVSYILIAGGLGFIYCYIKGPPVDNPRVATVFHVFLKLICCFAIYTCFKLPEIGISIVVLLIFTNLFLDQMTSSQVEIKLVNTEKKLNKFDSRDERISSKSKSTISFSPIKNNSEIFRKHPEDETFASLKNLKSGVSQPGNKSRRRTYVETPQIINQTLEPKKPKRKSLLNFVGFGTPDQSSTPTAEPFRRYLSEDEYIEQGYNYTKRELKKLRNFCNSPLAKPWETVTKLDNPKRFSSFVKGDAHVLEHELTNFEIELDKSCENEKSSFHVEKISDGEIELNDNSDLDMGETEVEAEGDAIQDVKGAIQEAKNVENKKPQEKIITSKPAEMPKSVPPSRLKNRPSNVYIPPNRRKSGIPVLKPSQKSKTK